MARGEPSPGADVGGASPNPRLQLYYGSPWCYDLRDTQLVRMVGACCVLRTLNLQQCRSLTDEALAGAPVLDRMGGPSGNFRSVLDGYSRGTCPLTYDGLDERIISTGSAGVLKSTR